MPAHPWWPPSPYACGRTGPRGLGPYQARAASQHLREELITGKWIDMSESETSATGMWVHGADPSNTTSQGYWDKEVLEIKAGGREDGCRVRGWLGDIDVSGGGLGMFRDPS